MIIVENADTGKDMARFKGFASRPGDGLAVSSILLIHDCG